jgi:predicted small integral membrane protein
MHNFSKFEAKLRFMIQRIQSVLLFVASALNLLVLFFPVWEYMNSTANATVNALEIAVTPSTGDPFLISFTENPIHIAFLALTLIACLFLLVVIFRFKDRKQQMKLAYLGMGILMVEILSLILLTLNGGDVIGSAQMTGMPDFGLIFPILALLLTWMAVRRIKADEELVKSVDRFR